MVATYHFSVSNVFKKYVSFERGTCAEDRALPRSTYTDNRGVVADLLVARQMPLPRDLQFTIQRYTT